METTKALVDLEHKDAFIRFNAYYRFHKVTPSSNAHNLAMEFADDWETFKALVEHANGQSLKKNTHGSKQLMDGQNQKKSMDG